jgi:hypothetical protein
MSVQAMVWVIERSSVPANLRPVAMAVANHADQDGTESFAAIDTLAWEANKSRSQTIRDLASLKERGFIRPGNQAVVGYLPPDRRPTVYDLVMDASTERDPASRPVKRHASGNPASTRHRGRAGATPMTTGVSSEVAPGSHPGSTGVAPVTPKPSFEPSLNRLDSVCASEPAAQDGTSSTTSDLVAVHWDQIVRVLSSRLTPSQRQKITAQGERDEINTRMADLFERGWSADRLLAELQARASVNSQTVKVGSQIIKALKALEPVDANGAVFDPWKPPEGQATLTDANFEAFWDAYGHKKSKQAALAAYMKARESTSAATILEGAKRYREHRAGKDPKFTKHAATWLNDHCWKDVYETEFALTGPSVREPLSDRRRREAEEALAAYEADLAAAADPDATAWDGTVIDAEGTPA